MAGYLSIKNCFPIYFLSFYLIRQPHQLGNKSLMLTDVEKEGGQRYQGLIAGGWMVLQRNLEPFQDAWQEWGGAGVPEDGAPLVSRDNLEERARWGQRDLTELPGLARSLDRVLTMIPLATVSSSENVNNNSQLKDCCEGQMLVVGRSVHGRDPTVAMSINHYC